MSASYSEWLVRELAEIKLGLLQPFEKSRPYDVVVGRASKKAMRLWTLHTAALTLLGAMITEPDTNVSGAAKATLIDTIRTHREALEKQNVRDYPKLNGKRMITIRRGWKVVWVDETLMHQFLGQGY